jgi:hypothetical protein
MSGEETIIDNWICNGNADEWANNNGYVPKDEILKQYREIEQGLVALLSLVEAVKKELESV